MLRKEDLVYRGQSVDEKGVTRYRLVHAADGGACPACGSKKFYANDRTSRTIVSIGPDGKKVIFDVLLIRYKCNKCKKTWYPQLIEDSGRYTGLFKTVTSEEILYGGKTLKETANLYDIPAAMMQKNFNWYLNSRFEKMSYRLPEEIVAAPVRVRNRRMAFLVDPKMMMLLDVVPAKDMGKADGAENVKSVVLIAPGLEKEAAEAFPNATVRFENAGLLQTGKSILVDEGVSEGLDRKTLVRYLETGDEGLLMKLVSQSIKILAVKNAYDFLLENSDDIGKLKVYNGELEKFREFAESLEEGEERLKPKVAAYIAEAVSELTKEANYYAGQRFSVDTIRKLLLVNEHSVYPIEGQEIQRNSGRRLLKRKVFSEKQKGNS